MHMLLSWFQRLNLPSKVVENGQELSEYNSKEGKFLIKLSKASPGEHFEGLDLLTKLLSNKDKNKSKRPLIEVIGDDYYSPEEIDEDFDWNVDQEVREESDELSLSGEKYGFANKYSGVMARISDEFCDLIDLKDAEHKSHSQRRIERLERESQDFSDDHYLFDMFDQNEAISKLISYQLLKNSHKDYQFDDDMRFRLKNLPKNEYILEKNTKKMLLFGVIDILFGYAYDQRVSEGEGGVESAWNIRKLSATLSWFHTYASLKEVVVTCVRRSLCYPLYRHWNLSMKVLQDVIEILNVGQIYVMRCFLDIHRLFNESGDGKYILNELYVTDYCVWLQHVRPSTFRSLASALTTVRISKAELDLDLDVLERAAHLAIEEHQKCESVAHPQDGQSEPLMHQTSSECSSNTSETTFSSSELEETVTKKGSNIESIDSDDDCPHKIFDDISSNGNDSDDELSS